MLVNTGDMDFYMDEIRKITIKQLRSENKMRNFRWIAILIGLTGEDVVWVVGGPGVMS